MFEMILHFFFSLLATSSQCEAGVDLYFLIDSTGSLGINGHETMKRWAADLCEEGERRKEGKRKGRGGKREREEGERGEEGGMGEGVKCVYE